MRTSLVLAFVVLLSVPAAAKPPAAEGFVRIDEFNQLLAGKLQELREAEEFEKKPFEEQLLIKWGKDATSFKHVRKITGPDVVDTIFEYEELLKEPPTDVAQRIAKKLPEVLKAKYGESLKMNKKFKLERFKVGKILVAQLVKQPLHVRQLAIECLDAVHHTRRGYVAEDPKDKRVKKQKAWKDYIDRVKK
ncbi:MAG: hypothetical protein ACYS0E_17420 [Planctomycetota bacterium]|jgi:hypothetical protein